MLANATDLCFQYMRCDLQRPLHSHELAWRRPLQSLYGAFRDHFNFLAAWPTRRMNFQDLNRHREFVRDPVNAPKSSVVRWGTPAKPKHDRVPLKSIVDEVAAASKVSCEWRIDVVVARCNESIIPGLALMHSLVPARIPAHCVRVVVHERCLPPFMRKCASAALPSWDMRDRLLRMERFDGRCGSQDVYVKHAQWARGRGDWANGILFLPAVWLDGIGERPRSRYTQCLLLRMLQMAASAKGSLEVRLPGGAQQPAGHVAAIFSLEALQPVRRATDVRLAPEAMRHEPFLRVGDELEQAPQAQHLCKRPPEPIFPQLVHRALSLLITIAEAEMERIDAEAKEQTTTTTTTTRTHARHRGLGLRFPFGCLEPDFVLYNRELLPPLRGPLCAAATAADDGEQPSRPLARFLEEHQSKAAIRSGDCNASRLVRSTLVPSGWFSTLNQVLKPFGRAIKNDKALLTPSLPAYTLPTCSRRDLSCFFLPFSSCDTASYPVASRARGLNMVVKESTEGAGTSLLPPSHRSYGTFRAVSALISFVTRPSSSLAAAIEAARVESGLEAAEAKGKPIIGLHIRRGDACHQGEQSRASRRCWSAKEYMDRILPYAKAIGSKTLYVATDSRDALSELKKRYSDDFNILSLKGVERFRDRRPPDVIDARLQKRIESNASDTYWANGVAWRATIDAELLSRCDVLVGLFSSNLFRTAFAMRAAKVEAMPLFISLDSPWCFDAGLLAGHNYESPVTEAAVLEKTWRYANRFVC